MTKAFQFKKNLIFGKNTLGYDNFLYTAQAYRKQTWNMNPVKILNNIDHILHILRLILLKILSVPFSTLSLHKPKTYLPFEYNTIFLFQVMFLFNCNILI